MDRPASAPHAPSDETDQVLDTGRTLLQLAHVLVRLEDLLLSGDLDVSYRQMRILKHVGAGITSGTELCRIFGVSASAISETLESLVRRGLLKREPNEMDRRAVKLVLTKRALRLNKRAEQVERDLAREVLAFLDADEVEQLHVLGAKLLAPNQESLIARRLALS